MPTRTKQQQQQSAAEARKAAAAKPKGYRIQKARDRKRKMGPISRQEIYPKEKLMELAGWGRGAWREAIDTGLEITKNGHGISVTGEAYFRWCEHRARVTRK